MFGIFSKKKPARIDAAKSAKAAAEKPAAKKAAAAPLQPPAKAKVAAPKVAPNVSTRPEPPVSAGSNLDRAKSALDKRAVPADRQKLIQQALAVHQAQSKKLDQLPDETRQKLRAMALKAFVLGGPKDKNKLN